MNRTPHPSADGSTARNKRQRSSKAGHRSKAAHSQVKGPHAKFPRRSDTTTVRQPAADHSSVPLGSALTVDRVQKSYEKAKAKIPVLKGVSLTVETGEFISIVGQSGSGKSTLLHLLGTLDVPDSGKIFFGNQRIDNCKTKQRDRLRNNHLGMIFQFYHLLPELTTLENVLVPMMIRHSLWSYRLKRSQYLDRAKHLLEMVGLSHRITHRPTELSGGEMQRTAIARALIAEPEILLADEPTGNLDLKNGKEIMEVLHRLNQEERVTVLMVTHDQLLAEEANRIIHLVDGRVAN